MLFTDSIIIMLCCMLLYLLTTLIYIYSIHDITLTLINIIKYTAYFKIVCINAMFYFQKNMATALNTKLLNYLLKKISKCKKNYI